MSDKDLPTNQPRLWIRTPACNNIQLTPPQCCTRGTHNIRILRWLACYLRHAPIQTDKRNCIRLCSDIRIPLPIKREIIKAGIRIIWRHRRVRDDTDRPNGITLAINGEAAVRPSGGVGEVDDPLTDLETIDA